MNPKIKTIKKDIANLDGICKVVSAEEQFLPNIGEDGRIIIKKTIRYKIEKSNSSKTCPDVGTIHLPRETRNRHPINEGDVLYIQKGELIGKQCDLK